MVPALFADDEKEAILGSVRDEVTKLGLVPSRENCWRHFVNTCADNLHIVLAMSPVGDQLRTRCRNFPGLVNNTVIDWFMPWPEQALLAVATVFLGDPNDTATSNIPDDFRQAIVRHVVHVFNSRTSTSSVFVASLGPAH